MKDDRDSIGTSADPHPTQFKKGWKGGPGRPKGVKNGEGQKHRNGETVEREDVPVPMKRKPMEGSVASLVRRISIHCLPLID